MNSKTIQKFVMRYLEAQRCEILEKSPSHVTVKLSPEADKDLTNRSYYWSFIERTGAAAETMSFTFIFDKEKMDDNPHPSTESGLEPTASHGEATKVQADTILGTYFGIAAAPAPRFGARVLQEELTYGCRRLEQIFASVRKSGRFVQLFEELPGRRKEAASPSAYSTWLCINYKLEFLCDMKRDELHSLSIHLATGKIVEQFHDRLVHLKLTPRLPPSVHLQRNKLSVGKAASMLETFLESKIKTYDHHWATEAQDRLKEELARIHSYYDKLIPAIEEEHKEEALQQYRLREQEVRWQYEPRINASVINCGIFHLKSEVSG